jgi:hypothetical protein
MTTRQVPDDAPLTAEEEAAYARQGQLIQRDLDLEERMRAEGKPVPPPFDGAEWGD